MIKLDYIDSGNGFDFSNISEDYAKYRGVYPQVFLDKILENGLCKKGQTVLDLGTGTGALPRLLSKYGAKFVGVDISENQIKYAKKLSEGVDIEYIVSPVEKIKFPDATFDVVTACMCFTYFDKSVLMPCLHRILKDNGRFVIMSMVWLPEESPIAKKSEELILKYNPKWNGFGFKRPTFDKNGLPTSYEIGNNSGFKVDKSFSFDIPITFTRESWHGRIRATRGLASSSITEKQKEAFDKEHLDFLAKQPESFKIIHSATFCILKKI